MANNKPLLKTDTADYTERLTERSKAKASASNKSKKSEFKKPSTDFYKLDLVIRKTEETTTTYTRKSGMVIKRPIYLTSEEIEINYKEYLSERARAEGTTISQYIHNLIDKDMKRQAKKTTAGLEKGEK